MQAGLQVWDANAVMTLDTSDRMGIVIGFQDAIPASGSVVVPKFADGEPFYFTQMSTRWQDSRGFVLPTVSISGNTLSWTNAGPYGLWRILWGIR